MTLSMALRFRPFDYWAVHVEKNAAVMERG
jgi:hypothetical protein